jgi:hypothetical protein
LPRLPRSEGVLAAEAVLLSQRNSLLSFIGQVGSGQNPFANLKYVILNFSQQLIDFAKLAFLGAGSDPQLISAIGDARLAKNVRQINELAWWQFRKRRRKMTRRSIVSTNSQSGNFPEKRRCLSRFPENPRMRRTRPPAEVKVKGTRRFPTWLFRAKECVVRQACLRVSLVLAARLRIPRLRGCV